MVDFVTKRVKHYHKEFDKVHQMIQRLEDEISMFQQEIIAREMKLAELDELASKIMIQEAEFEYHVKLEEESAKRSGFNK